MRIEKYSFDTKEQVEILIDALGTATDEDGNTYPTHNNSIVHLGFIDEKYSVDVLWKENEAIGWDAHRIDVEGNGVHSFAGLEYQTYKV